MIQRKRVYDEPSAQDGVRFLVDRLWPRGLRKEDLHAEGWLKDVAPSTELRKWFSHDPEKWLEFQNRYFTELDGQPQGWEKILDAARKGNVTLLYSSHDAEHNNAVALQKYLEKKLARKSAGHR